MFGLKNKNKIDTSSEKIDELLSRGVEEVFIKDHLREMLLSGKELRVKLGIDPTGPAIHLGRAVALRKLRAFQDLGHKAVLIMVTLLQNRRPSDKLKDQCLLTRKLKQS
jgi:hypothetical protein